MHAGKATPAFAATSSESAHSHTTSTATHLTSCITTTTRASSSRADTSTTQLHQWVVSWVHGSAFGLACLTQIVVGTHTALVADARDRRSATAVARHAQVGLHRGRGRGRGRCSRSAKLDEWVSRRMHALGLTSLAQIVVRTHCAVIAIAAQRLHATAVTVDAFVHTGCGRR